MLTTRTTTIRRAIAVIALVATGIAGFAPSATAQQITLAPGAEAFAPEREYYRPGPFIPVVPPTYAYNLIPTFEDYLTCSGGTVYAAFSDPDGPDEDLTVHLTSFYTSGEMDVYVGTDGVFFYLPVTLPIVHTVVEVWAEDVAGGESHRYQATLYSDGTCGDWWQA